MKTSNSAKYAQEYGFNSAMQSLLCYFSKYLISFIFKYFFADNTQEEDKLLHTLQTLGHLSKKAARRIYFNIIHHLNIIDKYLLVPYISNLVEFLRLTKYLNTVNEKILPVNGEKKEESQNEKEKNE